MNKLSVTLQEEHFNLLRDIVIRKDGKEGGAYILFGKADIGNDPWGHYPRKKLVSKEIIKIPNIDYISSSPQHITWSTNSFTSILKKAKDENLIPGIVHSHPSGFCGFSSQDDANESELVKMAQNRNGDKASLASVVLTPKGSIAVRLWTTVNAFTQSSLTCVIGKRMKLYYDKEYASESNLAFNRQALAFGKSLNEQLQRLRVGIVGCGGTGSAVAMLLTRLGIGKLILFDNDVVEMTNLNRLHGARLQDATVMRPKVETLQREINNQSLVTKVVSKKAWIGDKTCQDDLKSCDILFGCTDDHDGRMLLNRLAYFYAIPVFDMGVAIQVAKDEEASIIDLSGRVTKLIPGAPCLLCYGIIDPEQSRAEHIRRSNPEEYKRLRNEAYVLGEGNPNPAVVTFTTETACLAVNEFLHTLTGFKKIENDVWQWRRRFHFMKDRPIGVNQDKECPICSKKDYWGRCDVEPFLDRIG